MKDRLGHGSIRTTLDWYGHLFKGHDSEQLEALAGMIRATSVVGMSHESPIDGFPDLAQESG